MVTQQRLRELFIYNPEAGTFTRLIRVANQHPGTIAGYCNPGGYWKIGVDGRAYQAARLAWLYMTGDWPANQIDHRDLNPSNNSWSNLRLASCAENNRNRKTYCNSTTGFKGVFYDKIRCVYRARIQVNKKITDLGKFPTALAAAMARESKLKSLHGEFARAF